MRHPEMAQWYQDYLQSPEWMELRGKIFLKRGEVCEDCRRCKTGLTLHHTTYARVTHERQADMRILCPWCHRRAHRTHDIPYLFMIYRPLTEENQRIFHEARLEPTPVYPSLRRKKE